VIAAVLHLDEGAAARCGDTIGRCEPPAVGADAQHVVGDGPLLTVAEDGVHAIRQDAPTPGLRPQVDLRGAVDAATGEDEVRARVVTSQPAQSLPGGGIGGGRDRAGVEDANVGGLIVGHHLTALRGQPAGQVGHLGVVHLAAERGDRNPKRHAAAHGRGAGTRGSARSPERASSSAQATAPA